MADKTRMITIKTKDGTLKKVSFAEFQKMQKTEPGRAGGAPSQKKGRARQSMPAKKKGNSAARRRAATKQGAPNAQQERTPAPPSDSQTSSIMPDPLRDDTAARVESVLGFSIPSDLEGRFSALVHSRIHDIRTDEQVRDYAIRPAEEGGLGFSESRADALVAAVTRAASGEIPQPKQPAGARPSDAPRTMSIPQKSRPTASTKLEKPPTPVPPAQNANSLTPKHVRPKSAPSVRIPARPAPGRQGSAMRDVHPPARSKGPIGPIDELGLMRLVDVRRLGGSLAERKERLIRKFTTLKSESYPLYLKGRSAWFLSPLYRAYQDSIVRAINAGSPMSDVIGSGGADDLNAEEFQMLIDVNRTLKI